MKRCATCRFMAAERGLRLYDAASDDWTTSEHRTCTRVLHGNGDPYRTEAPTDPAVVVDFGGYAARLVVLPTFGCVLHEPKETPETSNTPEKP